MLDGSYFFECECGSSEHTLRFDLDREVPTLYTSVFLNDWRPWYKRVWVGIKYIFGYKCKYGHWDCWSLRESDAKDLLYLVDEFLELYKKKED